MVKIAISGLNGAMGKVLKEAVDKNKNFEVAGTISYEDGNIIEKITDAIDVLIDFSHPNNLDYILEFAEKNNCALLICTTGFSEEQKQKIEKFGEKGKVVLSSNTSIGINIMRKIIKSISKELFDNHFDVEILEKHHNKKIDAPSGTAKTLKSDVQEFINKDVPVSAMRLGTIPGEHTVIYAGNDEILEIKHTALSKKIFAEGALSISEKLIDYPIGFYDTMDFYK